MILRNGLVVNVLLHKVFIKIYKVVQTTYSNYTLVKKMLLLLIVLTQPKRLYKDVKLVNLKLVLIESVVKMLNLSVRKMIQESSNSTVNVSTKMMILSHVLCQELTPQK